MKTKHKSQSEIYKINNSETLNAEILTTILSVIIQDTNLSVS